MERRTRDVIGVSEEPGVQLIETRSLPARGLFVTGREAQKIPGALHGAELLDLPKCWPEVPEALPVGCSTEDRLVKGEVVRHHHLTLLESDLERQETLPDRSARAGFGFGDAVNGSGFSVPGLSGRQGEAKVALGLLGESAPIFGKEERSPAQLEDGGPVVRRGGGCIAILGETIGLGIEQENSEDGHRAAPGGQPPWRGHF